MMLWIEGLTALIIAAIIFVTSLFQLKKEHLGDDPVAVRLGAALQGLLFGSVVAFVMLPLRLQLMADGAPPEARDFRPWLIALGLIWIIRSGIIARAPLIGHPFRAYRIASLKQIVTLSQGRIDRLEALDRPKGDAPP